MKTRVTLDLTPEQLALLETLVQHTDAASKVDVLRDALRLYAFLLDGQRQGKELGQRVNGEWERILLFPLVR